MKLWNSVFAHINSSISCLLIIGSVIFSPLALATKGIVSDEADPHFSTLRSQETFTDMEVKALNGPVRMTRVWNGSSWSWNERWNDLSISYGAPRMTFSVTTGSLPEGVNYTQEWFESLAKLQQMSEASRELIVSRAGQVFRKSSESGDKIVYENQQNQYITRTSDGYDWADRMGNTIHYDTYGMMQSYADRNDNRIYLERDANGYINIIKDRFHNTLITYTWEPIPNASQVYNRVGQLFTPQRLIKLTDYSGRSVSYGWNASNQMATVTDVRGEVWTYTYTNGSLSQIKDPEGRATTYVFKDGRFVSRMDADGRGVSFTYHYDKEKEQYYQSKTYSDGRVEESWISGMGQVERKTLNGEDQTNVTYVLSDNSTGLKNLINNYSTRVIYWYLGNRLTNIERPDPPDAASANAVYIKYKKARDAQGNLTITEYDQWSNELKVTNPDGSVRNSTWHKKFALPLTTVNERGVITTYDYDEKGNLLVLTEAKGTPDQRVTRYTYDDYGHEKTVTTGESIANNTVLATTISEYDDHGNLNKETDPEGGITTYSDYDALGNARIKIDARANQLASNSRYSWRMTYDPVGDLLSDVDPYARGVTYTYSKSGDLHSVTTANGSEIILISNAQGKPISLIDANGKISSIAYDKNNRPSILTDSNGNKIQTLYDDQGRAIRTIDGENNVTQFTYVQDKLRSIKYPTYTELMDYDNRDRLKKTIQEANGKNYISTRGYDEVGNLTGESDALENSTSYEYDSFNRIVKITNANNDVTRFVYDARDNLVQVKDPENRITIYTYDRNDKLIGERKGLDPNIFGTRSSTFDGNGYLSSVVNPDSEKKTYEYDQANRLVKIMLFASKDHTFPVKVVDFSYNEKNQLASWGQQVSSSLPENVMPTSDIVPLSEAYTYTNLGQLESTTVGFGSFSKTYTYSYYPNGLKKTYTNPEGVVYTYYYNKNNELMAIHIPNNGQVTYSDFNWFMPQILMLPGGQKITYSYTDFLQVKERYLKDAGAQVIAHSLYEYDAEKNVTNIEALDGKYRFGYDNLYRLQTVEMPIASSVNDESFTYDGVGNRVGRTASAEQTSEIESLTYNVKNQLLQRNSSKGVNTQFTYTKSGHTQTQIVNGVTTEYIYNHEERLISVKRNGNVIAEYAFNPKGQRIKKTVNGTTTWYLYNENGLAAEYTSTGALIKEYHFHPQKSWMTDPLFMRTAVGDVYYYYNDHLGTPQQLLDKAGNIVWHAKYDAFGKTNIAISTVENNLRFPGQYFDEETGLYQNFHRDYDPELGRYIESDPIGLDGGINTYIYSVNNPYMNLDPTGENPLLICVRYPRQCAGTAAAAAKAAQAAAKKAAAYICQKNPKACKDLLECIKNPLKCSGFCEKKPNTSYHGKGNDGVCDVPGCKPGDNPNTATLKKVAAEACVAMREFVAVACFKGKMDAAHKREFEEAKQKVKDCDKCGAK